MSNSSAPSWGPPRSDSNMSPSTCWTVSLRPARAMISRPTRALPGRTSTVALRPSCRAHTAAANQPCAPATSSSDVPRGGRRMAFSDFLRRQPRELVLARDVDAPVLLLLGRLAVDLEAAAVAHDPLEVAVPLP